ncbi:hypothetical protein [Halomarina pelagica]|uniref:hypothetical protein n=1 Tax=Halomarina pelagica TaxID=2961599 RepID=UPI0020C21D7C|nr:hypothetical protein [Halomarina sp. BND7]
METLFDPESLRSHEGVTFLEETHIIDKKEFEAARENLDSHVAVGVTNDEGEVLLMNDGSHGWTLTAFTVEPDENWTDIGQRGVEKVTGATVQLARPERVRHIELSPEGEENRQNSIYNVVVRAVPVEGRPVADEQTLKEEDIQDIGWFNEVPPEQEGDVADDIRLFVG